MIYESDLMQDFLQLKQQSGGGEAGVVTGATTARPARGAQEEKKVQLRILLPDKTVTTVTISEYWRTNEVYEVRRRELYIHIS